MITVDLLHPTPQLHMGLLPLEPHDYVNTGTHPQDYPVLECREMTAQGDVSGKIGGPYFPDQCEECRCPAREGYGDGENVRVEVPDVPEDPPGITGQGERGDPRGCGLLW